MAGTSPAMTKINLNGFSGCYCHGIRVQFKPEPFSLHLSPLAGRGRSRSAAKSSGEGDSPRTRTRGESPSPGSHLAMRDDLSPQAGRGDHRLVRPRHLEHGFRPDLEIVAPAPRAHDGTRQPGLVDAVL